MVLDTDAFNEIDDQFAIAYALLCPERIRMRAICAAPFWHNGKSTSPENGMMKSYDEILKILKLMGREDLNALVHKGSCTYLPDEKTPVPSNAVDTIVSLAREHSPESPLYVVAIGAITNVASAILTDREAMVNNTVIVWLGGHALHWKDNTEYNLRQDVASARVVLGSGAPVVLLPCQGVVSSLRTTEGELRHWLESTNPLAEYLMNNAIREAETYAKGKAWSRCIWDVSAVAWLMNDHSRFLSSYLTAAPIPQYDLHYSVDPTRHPICYVYSVNRDAIFTDLFTRLRSLHA